MWSVRLRSPLNELADIQGATIESIPYRYKQIERWQ